MESKYRSTKRDRKRFEAEAEDLQARLNVHIKQIADLEAKLEQLKQHDNNNNSNNNESDEGIHVKQQLKQLENELKEKLLTITDLERQLAGSRASSRWAGSKSKATQLIAGKKLEDTMNNKVKKLEEDLEAQIHQLQAQLSEARQKKR